MEIECIFTKSYEKLENVRDTCSASELLWNHYHMGSYEDSYGGAARTNEFLRNHTVSYGKLPKVI